MAIVVDPSAILALAYVDEDADYAGDVIEAIAADEAIVPALFWFEIRNSLIASERRSRLSVDMTTAFLGHLGVLRFEFDRDAREDVVLDVARRHALSSYDAAYLELATRKSLPLATLDSSLVRAAKAQSVTIFGRS